MKIANRFFENKAKFIYLVKTVTDKNLIWLMLATMKFRTFSSRVLSQNVEIKLYKTMILSVVLYGPEFHSVTLGL
jgi:hypothetical protein